MRRVYRTGRRPSGDGAGRVFLCAKALHGSAALAAHETVALSIGQAMLQRSVCEYVQSLELDCAVAADDMTLNMIVQP